MLARQRLDPMVEPSARAQFRQACFRQITARVGHTLAKAAVMRLLSLPLPAPACAWTLARNRPGPADSFTFSFSSPSALLSPESSFSLVSFL